MYKNFQQCKDKLEGILAIDFYLAKSICHCLNIKSEGLMFHSILATSVALRNGHSCLRIEYESEKVNWSSTDSGKEIVKIGYQFPTQSHWHQYLLESKITAEDNHPIVYDLNRLYLRRYWQFEVELSKIINNLIKNNFPVDMDYGKQIINQLFVHNSNTQQSDKQNNAEIDWQKIAVANALDKQFTIIAGGPGTGKTYTVTKLLAALQALSANNLKIAMIAPTGKAAQRLNESIQKSKNTLQHQQLISIQTIQSIPDNASTVHRLLGVKGDSHNFHYNKENRLPFDTIVIDETSMIDLPLMCRLLRAIKEDCRVIMLGDADQLPPVAAGNILSDLIVNKTPCYSQFNSQQLSQLTGLYIPVTNTVYDYLTVLQKSHRFDGIGEIAQLAKLVINGKTDLSWNLLQQAKEQITFIELKSMFSFMDKLIEQYYAPLFSSSLNISKAFKLLNQFRFLVVTRLGEQGLVSINEYIKQYLLKNGYINENKEFYPGRPIMVTKNHYQLELYNGDIGILWLNKEDQLYAVFPLPIQQPTNSTSAESDNIDYFRWISLGRLPEVETVYAMTIHKTQGSEFSHVALILPNQDSPILSQELLYTGISRASCKLSVCSDRLVWELAVKRKIRRYSGLKQRIFST
jgi:exodeoxyribonuclease V alpha subunit